MANGRSAGVGRDVLFALGLVGWLHWLNCIAYIGEEDYCKQSRVLEKYELLEPTNEIVVLIANIIQEAM